MPVPSAPSASMIAIPTAVVGPTAVSSSMAAPACRPRQRSGVIASVRVTAGLVLRVTAGDAEEPDATGKVMNGAVVSTSAGLAAGKSTCVALVANVEKAEAVSALGCVDVVTTLLRAVASVVMAPRASPHGIGAAVQQVCLHVAADVAHCPVFKKNAQISDASSSSSYWQGSHSGPPPASPTLPSAPAVLLAVLPCAVTSSTATSVIGSLVSGTSARAVVWTNMSALRTVPSRTRFEGTSGSSSSPPLPEPSASSSPEPSGSSSAGAADGTGVGLGINGVVGGAVDGEGDRDAVGLHVGVVVGVVVGVGVGVETGVGAEVGDGNGIGVGFKVGSEVCGAEVGAGVGSKFVGAEVGKLVGGPAARTPPPSGSLGVGDCVGEMLVTTVGSDSVGQSVGGVLDCAVGGGGVGGWVGGRVVGSCVSNSCGTRVGDGVGLEVGKVEPGDSDGAETVGSHVGATATVGEDVPSACVGDAFGCTVSPKVGPWVGLRVGLRVGPWVGLGVGIGLGDAVGVDSVGSGTVEKRMGMLAVT